MAKERWEREREGLQRLARVFAEEARGGLLGEALEVMLEASQLGSGAAFAVDHGSLDLVAERAIAGRGAPCSAEPCKEALRAIAERVLSTRKPVFIASILRSDLEADQKT